MDKELEIAFLELREEFIWLKICYNTYLCLYEARPEVDEMIRKIAPIFFYDLNRIILDYIYILIYRITEKSCFGNSRKRANLTISHINKILKDKNIMSEQIEELSPIFDKYHEIIKGARDKMIAHVDLGTRLAGESLGVHQKKEIDEFFQALQQYSDAVGNILGVGPLDFRTVPGKGDVIDFLTFLKRAYKS